MASNEETLEMNPKKNAEIKKALMKAEFFEKASYTPYIGDGYEDAKEKILFIGDCKLPVRNEFTKDDKKDIFPKINYCTQVVHYCKLIKDLDDIQDIKTLKRHLIPQENKRLSMESIRTLKKYAKNKSLNYEDFSYYNFYCDQFDGVTIPNQGLSSKSDKLKQYQNRLLLIIEKLNPDKIVIENSVVENKIIGRSRDSSFFKTNNISYEIADDSEESSLDDVNENLNWIEESLNTNFLDAVKKEEHQDIYRFLSILNKIPIEEINKMKDKDKMEFFITTKFLHKASTLNKERLNYKTTIGIFLILYKEIFKKDFEKNITIENSEVAKFLIKKFYTENFNLFEKKLIKQQNLDEAETIKFMCVSALTRYFGTQPKERYIRDKKIYKPIDSYKIIEDLFWPKNNFVDAIDNINSEKGIIPYIQILIIVLLKKVDIMNYYKVKKISNQIIKLIPKDEDIPQNSIDIYRDFKGYSKWSFSQKTTISVNAFSLFECMRRMRTIKYNVNKNKNLESIEYLLDILERNDYFISKNLIPFVLEYIKGKINFAIPYIWKEILSPQDINDYINDYCSDKKAEQKITGSGVDNILKSIHNYFKSNKDKFGKAKIMTKRIYSPSNSNSSGMQLIAKRSFNELKKDGRIVNWNPDSPKES